ncbi:MULTISPECIES: sugar kinase [unclassified Rhodococcus (in: high G+C Gram-positive bacteria)]|uniref:sugar kinase n=1 Tax=unclassified Rhodococcus (in: high G+C Gram-positive bacteria) TaxID=192944 RepID=UPI001639F385|nr:MULTISPECIES: sugar kinase [unclassified Rhodococcus (in: high G+C Gram-positive bacteria)]MBC2642180.1 sugar kinase [Rhodococcus sp. 3A]MBC2893078.1 sugar kinase [Rhodococcus sp. 4CII]
MTVLTFGETMALTRAVDTGALAHTSALHLGIGGAESNFAIALRRLGADVTWIGRVGRDSLGDLIERELRAEGITVDIVRDPDAPTGLMVKERRTATATRVWYYRAGSAGSRLTTSDVADDRLRSASLLHVTGITPALSDTARKTTLHCVEQARALGIPVSFDLNYRRALWSPADAGPVFRELIELADIVFAGVDEAAIAVGEGTPAELAARICDLGPTESVLKLGEQGCLALIDGETLSLPAVPVTVVDSVGAGDGFVAGYIAERLAGKLPLDRLRTAVTVGAFACAVSGDWEGMPRRDELGLLTTAEPVTR